MKTQMKSSLVKRAVKTTTLLILGCMLLLASCNKSNVMPSSPKFSGNLQEYLAKTIKYPESDKAKKISGTVYVGFTIDKNGKVGNVKIAKGVDSTLDAEALRVVKAMPYWIPGRDKNGAVDVQYYLPICFELK